MGFVVSTTCCNFLEEFVSSFFLLKWRVLLIHIEWNIRLLVKFFGLLLCLCRVPLRFFQKRAHPTKGEVLITDQLHLIISSQRSPITLHFKRKKLETNSPRKLQHVLDTVNLNWFCPWGPFCCITSVYLKWDIIRLCISNIILLSCYRKL